MDWKELFDRARKAGLAAGNAATPHPMYVQFAGQVEKVDDGPCGFAWVNVRPATGPFVKWLRANNIGHKAYGGGWDIWIADHRQSLERKRAHATAFAKVLESAGIRAYGASRID